MPAGLTTGQPLTRAHWYLDTARMGLGFVEAFLDLPPADDDLHEKNLPGYPVKELFFAAARAAFRVRVCFSRSYYEAFDPPGGGQLPIHEVGGKGPDVLTAEHRHAVSWLLGFLQESCDREWSQGQTLGGVLEQFARVFDAFKDEPETFAGWVDSFAGTSVRLTRHDAAALEKIRHRLMGLVLDLDKSGIVTSVAAPDGARQTPPGFAAWLGSQGQARNGLAVMMSDVSTKSLKGAFLIIHRLPTGRPVTVKEMRDIFTRAPLAPSDAGQPANAVPEAIGGLDAEQSDWIVSTKATLIKALGRKCTKNSGLFRRLATQGILDYRESDNGPGRRKSYAIRLHDPASHEDVWKKARDIDRAKS